MQKTTNTFLIYLLMATFYLSGCQPDSKMAFQYFESIHKPLERILLAEDSLQSKISIFVTDGDLEELKLDSNSQKDLLYEIRNDITKLEKTIQISKNEIEEMEVFNEEIELKRSALSLVSVYEEIVRDEMLNIYLLLEIPYDEYTDNDDIKMSDNMNSLIEKVDETNSVYYNTIEKYSEKYQLDIDSEED